MTSSPEYMLLNGRELPWESKMGISPAFASISRDGGSSETSMSSWNCSKKSFGSMPQKSESSSDGAVESAVDGVDGRLECMAELVVECECECECAEWISVGEELADEMGDD